MNRMCFNCLRGGHIKKNSKAKMKCFACQAEGHHAVICNLKNETRIYATDKNKEDSASYLVKSNMCRYY